MSVELLNLAERQKILEERRIARGKIKTEQQKFRENLRNQRSDDPVEACPDDTDNCCDEHFENVEKEVSTIINHPDDVERNKQINAAYADLYLSDPKAQKWAGTAAIVSKQVGCTMQKNVLASDSTLGEGNIAIFKNIYPVLKMYQEIGDSMSHEELLSCLNSKFGKDSEDVLKPLVKPLRSMADGHGGDAAIQIADHEQRKIIEDAMWSSWLLSSKAWLNSKLTFELFSDQSVYFVSNCSKPSNRELSFPYTLNVSNPESRVKYYKEQLVPKFDEIESSGEMAAIMKGIRATGGTH